MFVRSPLLPYEQEFTIFREWPEGIIDYEFELVYLIADGIELRLYDVMIGYCLLVLALYLVSLLACLNEFLYAFLYY